MESEKAATAAANKNKNGMKGANWISTLWRFMRYGRSALMFSALFMLLGVTMNYIVPQIIRFTVDNILKGDAPPAYLDGIVNKLGGMEFFRGNMYVPGLLVVVITVFLGVFAYFRRRASMTAAEKTSKHIKDGIYIHILSLPFSWHSSIQTGDIIQRATQDSDLIKRYVNNQLVELFRIVTVLLVGLTVMFFMDTVMTLAVVGFTAAMLLFSGIYFPKIAKNFKKTDEEEGKLTALLQENLTGIRVVRAFGRQADEKNKYEKKNEEYAQLWINFGKKLSFFWGSGDLFAGLQTVTILVLGAYLSVKGTMTLGSMLAFLSYNQLIIWPVRSLGRVLAETGKVKAAVKRLEEVFDSLPEEQTEGAKTALDGDIEFKNVSFSYDKSRQILDGVSFKITGGTVFGIVGATGSGKSTLVQLLNRLYDADSGDITINGVNVKDYDLVHLRKNVGLILQEPFLFSRNFADNILLSEAEKDSLQKYVDIASLGSTVGELKEGYDTMIGEKGVTLSGGQKQRVAIARTLIKNPPIVIFDDSLSAVDVETDKRIREALAENLKGTTVIIISHRLTSLMHADNILVLKDGKIEDTGTHGELIEREGTYKRLYEIQSNTEGEN